MNEINNGRGSDGGEGKEGREMRKSVGIKILLYATSHI